MFIWGHTSRPEEKENLNIIKQSLDEVRKQKL
jgi:hypothetical protein